MKLEDLIRQCRLKLKLHYRIGCTIRGPLRQAQLWCRDKTKYKVHQRREILSASAPIIASCLRDEFCELGPPVVQSLPGQSWHQWGEAADIYLVSGEASLWGGSPWEKITPLIHDAGLTTTSKKWHVQLRPEKSPLQIRGFCDSWRDVEAAMWEKFDANLLGNKPGTS